MKKIDLINFLNQLPDDLELDLCVPDSGGYDWEHRNPDLKDLIIFKTDFCTFIADKELSENYSGEIIYINNIS